jgi:hypothetical protein
MVHPVAWDFHPETSWKGHAYPGMPQEKATALKEKATVLNQGDVCRMECEHPVEQSHQACFQLDFAEGKSYCHCYQEIEIGHYHQKIELEHCMAYLRVVRTLEATGCPSHILLEIEMADCMFQGQNYMAYLRVVRTLETADCLSHVQRDSQDYQGNQEGWPYYSRWKAQESGHSLHLRRVDLALLVHNQVAHSPNREGSSEVSPDLPVVMIQISFLAQVCQTKRTSHEYIIIIFLISSCYSPQKVLISILTCQRWDGCS